ASWPSGYYFVNFRLRADTSVQYNLPLLLRARETPARLVLVAPTNTWQAYNTYGGRSNYVDRVTPVDLRYLFLLFRRSAPGLAPYTYLPRRRPFSHPVNRAAFRDDWAGLEGKISADLSLVNFLEERRIPYDVISDETFARYEGLDSATLVLFSNHSEYWSYAGMGVLRQLMDRGVSVLFLSGNNMYRGVEWLKGETMLVTEPVKDRAPVERLLGTFYTEAGYGEAWSPYRVVDTAHWSMLGTGLRPGDTFGGPSASGIETDKMGPFAEGFRLLAVGDNAAGGAHLVLKDFPAGNFLCNTSSIASWRGVRDDPAFRRFVLNLFVRSGVLTDPL
ncbi:MAG: N,N-dimethylformamidase beta subunit family domain-containing protein, partial [Bacteroidota bacterium]